MDWGVDLCVSCVNVWVILGPKVSASIQGEKMKNPFRAFALIFILILPAAILAAGFQVYPGARVEEIYEAKQPEFGARTSKPSKTIIFTTNDPFETVVAFYQGIGREYRVPGSPGKPTKLSTGQELKETYFMFDGAGDIMTSKHWVKIQRPYLSRERTKEGFQGRYGSIREVTAIIEEDKRTYP